MSHRLCLFFFSCFLAILHEEALLFSSGEKEKKNKIQAPTLQVHWVATAFYTYNTSEIHLRSCLKLKKIDAKLREFLHEFTANTSRNTSEDVHILLRDASTKETTSTYLVKNIFPQILTEFKNHLCHSRPVICHWLLLSRFFFLFKFLTSLKTYLLVSKKPLEQQ